MPSLRVMKGVAREIQRGPPGRVLKKRMFGKLSAESKSYVGKIKNNYGKVSLGLDETA